MDHAHGESHGKSLTSKLKSKVKGGKGKVHLPGHKKRQGNNGDSDSEHSLDESPRVKSGTGYRRGASTPFTIVKTTPLLRERPQTHNRDYVPSSAQLPSSTPTEISQPLQGNGGTRPKEIQPSPRPGMLEQVKQIMSSAAVAVGSTVGYYSEVENKPHKQNPSDPNAPSLMEKTKAALGLDKPSDPNAPTLMEKTKAALGMDKPSDPNAPSLIEKTKAALGMNLPSDANASSPTEKTKATSGMGPGFHPAAGSPQQPGIVDRVSGAVSSLFTGSGEDFQHTFPAHSDEVPKVKEPKL